MEGHGGLHPKFDTWFDQFKCKEKQKIEEVTGVDITSVRQHWLRFSLLNVGQNSVGLTQDFL